MPDEPTTSGERGADGPDDEGGAERTNDARGPGGDEVAHTVSATVTLDENSPPAETATDGEATTAADAEPAQRQTTEELSDQRLEASEPKKLPLELIVPLARWGYYIAFAPVILMLLTFDPYRGPGFVTPASWVFGGLTVLLLVNQVVFVVFYTGAALEAEIEIPNRYGRDVLETETGAGFLVVFNLLASFVLLYGLSTR